MIHENQRVAETAGSEILPIMIHGNQRVAETVWNDP